MFEMSRWHTSLLHIETTDKSGNKKNSNEKKIKHVISKNEDRQSPGLKCGLSIVLKSIR